MGDLNRRLSLMLPPTSRWLLAILAVALIARISAALVVGGEFYFADETIYVDTARRLLKGQGFGADYDNVPAYPVFLGLLVPWPSADLTILRVSQATIAAIGCVLVFWLADRIVNRRAAMAAGVVYALDPLLVIGGGLLYPEAVAALLLPLIVLAALNASERDRLGWSAMSGILLGLFALLRPVGLILPPVVGGWIAWTARGKPVRRLAHLGALVLAVLLVLAPWTVRNYGVHNRLVPVTNMGSHFVGPKGEGEVPSGLLKGVASEFWSNPGSFVARTAGNFVQFWELAPSRMVTDNPEVRQRLHELDPRLATEPMFPRNLRDIVSVVSFTLELTLALVGLVAVARTRWRGALMPAALIVTYAAGYALLVAKVRYRIPILPLLFLYTGAGAAALYAWMARPRFGISSAKASK